MNNGPATPFIGQRVLYYEYADGLGGGYPAIVSGVDSVASPVTVSLMVLAFAGGTAYRTGITESTAAAGGCWTRMPEGIV